MDFIKKFFGKPDNEVAIVRDVPVEDNFVENINQTIDEAIKDELEDHKEPHQHESPADKPAKKASEMAVFLKTDYFNDGYNIGYTHHSTDQLETTLRHLKAHFRLLIDEGIDARLREIAELKQELIQSSGISERLQKQLEQRIESLKENIERYQIEKELSVADEGMITKVIHSYREGFLRGIDQYKTEKFIAGSTGFFS